MHAKPYPDTAPTRGITSNYRVQPSLEISQRLQAMTHMLSPTDLLAVEGVRVSPVRDATGLRGLDRLSVIKRDAAGGAVRTLLSSIVTLVLVAQATSS